MVFGLPELLENILQHLGMKSLYIIQRVSHTLKNTIAASQKLCYTMYLTSKPAASIDAADPMQALNPLLDIARLKLGSCQPTTFSRMLDCASVTGFL